MENPTALDQPQQDENQTNTDTDNKINENEYQLLNADQNSDTGGPYQNTLQQQYNDRNQFMFSMSPPSQQSNTNDASKYIGWKEYQSEPNLLSQYEFAATDVAVQAAAAAAAVSQAATAPHPYDTLHEQQQQQQQQNMIPPSPFTPNQQQCFLADTYNYSQHRGSLPVIYDPNLLNQAAGIHVTAQAAAAAAAAAAMAQPPHVQMIDQNQYARRHTEGSLPLRSLGGVGSGRKHRANSTTGSNSAGNSRRNSKAASTISDGLGTEEEDEAKRKQFLERNRQAALKCRQRKKQWLANLQNRVEFLSADNEQLHSQATMLREEIINLKTLLLAHRDCKVAQANGTTVEMIQSVSSQSFNNIPLSSSTMISGAVTSNTSTPIFANTNLEMRGGPNLHPHQQLQQHQHHPQQ